MKSYEKQLEEFGREIADEVISKEKDYKYESSLDRYQIARSLSSIYSQDLRKATEDLDRSINRSLSRMRSQDQY
jgi:hypothetical protein